jgi:TRAP-type mannitol/chloroaromatic compound transport system substrate-binding protein
MSKRQAAALPRRKFLARASVATAASLAFPMIAKGQSGPLALRFQSAWQSKDIFHELAHDYAKLVADMTGGELRIEVLPAGAIAPAIGLLDAVSKGSVDGGHGALVHSYGRHKALGLWGSGPAFGMDANMLLAWHKWGGGKEFLQKIYASLGADVVSFPYAPLYTQPLGWFKKPLTKWEDFQDLKYRTAGMSAELFARMGAAAVALPAGEIASALVSGQIDAANFNNPSSDRALGLADASKVCIFQSYHQNAEQLEITFNKARYNALPPKLQAVATNAVDAASQNAMWKLIDRNSQDYLALQAQEKVHVYRTPASILLKQLEVYDELTAKMSADDPLCRQILESQKRFAERAALWERDVVVSRRPAYDHYFSAKTAPKKA